jgi:hypothetical protein
MSKFTFIYEEEPFPYLNEGVTAKRTVEFSAVSLTDILTEFENFLKGNGFVFDGNIDIVNDK